MVGYQEAHLDDVFHALADATRRAMVRRLADGRQTIGALSQPFDMSLTAASKHVKVLERAGLVRREIKGRVHHCSLDPAPLAGAAEWLAAYRAFWEERLDALEEVLAEIQDEAARGENNGGKA